MLNVDQKKEKKFLWVSVKFCLYASKSYDAFPVPISPQFYRQSENSPIRKRRCHFLPIITTMVAGNHIYIYVHYLKIQIEWLRFTFYRMLNHNRKHKMKLIEEKRAASIWYLEFNSLIWLEIEESTIILLCCDQSKETDNKYIFILIHKHWGL